MFDQSQPHSGVYDTLYLDQDLDGDLAEQPSRHVGKVEGMSEVDYPFVRFSVGDLVSSGSASRYSDAALTVAKENGAVGFALSVVYDTSLRLTCGKSSNGSSGCSFSDSAASAPVIRALPRSPLALGLFHHDGAILRLTPGGSARVSVMIGVPGSREDCFTALDEHYLDLERDELWVSLNYLDETGAPGSVRVRLKHHCCGILYHDQLKVPAKLTKPWLLVTLDSKMLGLTLARDFPVDASADK